MQHHMQSGDHSEKCKALNEAQSKFRFFTHTSPNGDKRTFAENPNAARNGHDHSADAREAQSMWEA